MADLVHAGFGQEGDGVMAAEKFKVEVLCSFIDKYSKRTKHAGEIIEITRKRIDEIMAVDPSLIREVEPQQ